MNTIKHLFTALLLLCATAATAHDFEAGGIYYSILSPEDKTVAVTFNEYSEYTGGVVIPQSVTYKGTTYSVTRIGLGAFRGCSGLTSIEIPNSVTRIGDSAFRGCTGLTNITIPNSVTSIDGHAFEGCTGLTSVKVESGNSVYDSRDNCNAIIETATNKLIVGCQNTIIPNSVTSIGNFAFQNCTGLTSITIPNSVTSIGNCAFSGCTGLTSVVVDGNNTKYDSRENCNAIIETETNTLIAGCKNTIIPNSVTSIGDNAFYKCTGLTSITIPNSVTSIGSSAFYGCTGLTSITIPNSVTSIGSSAFESTVWYNNQPDGVVYAGKVLYKYKGTMPSNTSITINDGTLSITSGAFAFCSGLTSITIPNSVTSIGSYAFQSCTGLTSITIPNSVTSIGEYAFYGCTGLTSVVIGNSVTSIEESAFYYCSGLTSIKVESGNSVYDSRDNCNAIIETATNKLIVGCQNTIIPNSVTSIGNYAFQNCTGLTSITIPNSVTSIGDFAFSGCTGLTSVEFNAENYTRMGNSLHPVFSGCTALSTVTIGEKVKNIPDYAFSGCTGLTSVVVDGNNTKYDSREDCNAIIETETNTLIAGCKNTIIPNSVTSIGDYAFYKCTGLTSITIPNSVTRIGDFAFSGCTELTSVEIPNSVTSIGNRAFEGTVWYNNQPDGVVYAGKVLYKYKGIFPYFMCYTI